MNGTLVALAFVLLFVLLFMGVPIGTSLGIPVAILVAATQITSFEYIAQFLYTKIADFTMLSLPFFLLAGDIMDGGGLSQAHGGRGKLPHWQRHRRPGRRDGHRLHVLRRRLRLRPSHRGRHPAPS